VWEKNPGALAAAICTRPHQSTSIVIVRGEGIEQEAPLKAVHYCGVVDGHDQLGMRLAQCLCLGPGAVVVRIRRMHSAARLRRSFGLIGTLAWRECRDGLRFRRV
jgi:hypothetical protein